MLRRFTEFLTYKVLLILGIAALDDILVVTWFPYSSAVGFGLGFGILTSAVLPYLALVVQIFWLLVGIQSFIRWIRIQPSPFPFY